MNAAYKIISSLCSKLCALLNSPKVQVFILALLAMTWPVGYLQYMLDVNFLTNIKLVFVYLFGNSAIILFPFFMLPSKRRWLILIPLWIIPFYCLANLWYFRFFGDFIPFSSLFLFNNFGDTLINSALGIVCVDDVMYILGAAVFSIAWFAYFQKFCTNDSFSIKAKIVGVSLCLLLFMAGEFRNIRYTRQELQTTYGNAIKEKYLEQRDCTTMLSFFNGGLVSFVIRNIANTIYINFKSKELSEQQKLLVESYLNNHNKLSNFNGTYLTKFCENRDKNLLFIVVESLNSEAVRAEIGINRVMPNLQTMLNDSSAIVCLDTKSQILAGVSSDGQFIYNTGLYPASDKITVMTYDDNEYHSIAKMLNKQSLEIICEPVALWNHQATNKSFGYNGIVDNLSKTAKEHNLIDDAQLFSTCLEVLDTISQSTFIFATTITMHHPYKSEFVRMPKWLSDSKLSNNYKDYYNMCHAFDKAFGEFMQRFKQTETYKNTVIVLASDHAKPDNTNAQEKPILFAALNTGVSMKIDGPIEQVDVFPTVLEIMGRSNATFKGVGYSALSPRPFPASRTPCKEMQEVANLILMSDYFKTNQ